MKRNKILTTVLCTSLLTSGLFPTASIAATKVPTFKSLSDIDSRCATCNRYEFDVSSDIVTSRVYTGTVTKTSSTAISGAVNVKIKGIFEFKVQGEQIYSSSRKFKEYTVTHRLTGVLRTYSAMGNLMSTETITQTYTTTELEPV